jgi:hypothetical protein
VSTKLLNTAGLLVYDSGDSDHIFEVLLVNAGLKTTTDFTIKQYTTYPPFMALPSRYYKASNEHYVLPLAVYSVVLALVLMLLDLCVVTSASTVQTNRRADTKSQGEGISKASAASDADTGDLSATPAAAPGTDTRGADSAPTITDGAGGLPLVQLGPSGVADFAFVSFCPPDVAFLVQVWIAFCVICSLMLRFLALAGPMCCILAATLWHSHYLELGYAVASAVPKYLTELVGGSTKKSAAAIGSDGANGIGGFSIRSLIVTAIQCVALAILAQAASNTDGGHKFFDRWDTLPNKHGAVSSHSIGALTRWLHTNAQAYTFDDGTKSKDYKPIITGDMVTLSIIKASTSGRTRISLHPQYENKRARERDRKGNQAFGLRTDSEIHEFATEYFHTDFWVVSANLSARLFEC